MSKHFLSYIILRNWVYSNLKESNKICTKHCPLNFSNMQLCVIIKSAQLNTVALETQKLQ